jgi:asparagine synthase (glutamine-hydrolysing)
MCAIGLVIGPGATEEALLAMLRRMAHRGDSEHLAERWSGPGAVLGANRLAIVDPAGGAQPFRSPDGLVLCVSNGEIYNHAALRGELAPYPFTSRCDTEVLLAGYLRWSERVVDHLRGMYAFAIVDLRGGRVRWLLARDPLGIKPLYLAQAGGTLHVASELKAFHGTAFDSVRALPPGTLWFDGAEQTRWQVPAFATRSVPDPPACVAEALEAAVRSHLPPPGTPLACLLSGGVDSSTVLLLARRLHDGPVEAWTLAAPGSHSGDRRAATAVCEHLGVQLRLVQPAAAELTDRYLAEGVWMTETWEPALVRNAVSYHTVCRAVRDAGHKLCLSGEGADEVFGGYDYVWLYPPGERDQAIRRSLVEVHRTYLQMADRASMAATLEVRVPYMDSQFVECCAGMQEASRLREGVTKWALRHAFPDALPQAIRLRPKLGMNAGAGYGSNDPSEGIYVAAVAAFYRDRPERRAADRATTEAFAPAFAVDPGDPEELYNFARFVEAGFHRLEGSRARPQLNTSRRRQEHL